MKVKLTEKEIWTAVSLLAVAVMLYIGGQFEEGRISAISFLVRFMLDAFALTYSLFRAKAFVGQDENEKPEQEKK